MSPVRGKVEVLAGVKVLGRRGEKQRTEDWRTLHWKTYQRNVYRLQKRIYQATRQGDWKRVHKLQRLLLSTPGARPDQAGAGYQVTEAAARTMW